MKKIITKIITIIFAFFLGLICTSYFYNKGNLDMTAHMAEATLPILHFEQEGELVNPTYGYTGEINASGFKESILPLGQERIVWPVFEKYNAKIRQVEYEVRSTDMERLIQNGTVEDLEDSGQYIKGSVKIKDLLEETEEYLLIFRVTLEDQGDVQFISRIKDSSQELITAGTSFAKEFHEATLDPQNDYPITQYLEQDSGGKNTSFACVDIHSKYKMVIWDGMAVTETKTPVITYLEIGSDIAGLKLEYEVSYENENGFRENYEVCDYFRVRSTNSRMYLLDYERKAERIFSAEKEFFEEKELNLGIQWDEITYLSNEEGNVVNFVVSGDLWSYDVAQNKLSRVFSFKNGTDSRGLHREYEIRLVNIEDSGSMDFIVNGYMNRGDHEGQTGVAVMHYDSLKNTTEEVLFIESKERYGILSKVVGELLYISYDHQMYLSIGGDIYAIDLNTKSVQILMEDLTAENYLISKNGDMIAWVHGEDRLSSTKITTMDMKTGIRQIYEADAGEYIRPLGFSGDDFIYGKCREADVIEDFAGNVQFPMSRVQIVDSKGEAIRNFDYSAKNKYVLSAVVENNRINLQCVMKNADGTYTETLAEAITSNEEEAVRSIVLSEEKHEIKKLEQVFRFEIKVQGKRKDIVPKQVLFEDDRTISLEKEGQAETYRSYGKGVVTGVYPELRKAVQTAYADMGMVTDQKGRILWERGNRKTRSVLELADGCEGTEASDSLEAGVKLLLEQEGIYADVRTLLDEGKSPYQILKDYSQKEPENFTGCNLSSVLYYISRGNYVLAMTDAESAEILVGYDTQNIYVLDAQSGQVTKIGQKDAAARYEAAGNVFFSYLQF